MGRVGGWGVGVAVQLGGVRGPEGMAVAAIGWAGMHACDSGSEVIAVCSVFRARSAFSRRTSMKLRASVDTSSTAIFSSANWLESAAIVPEDSLPLVSGDASWM